MAASRRQVLAAGALVALGTGLPAGCGWLRRDDELEPGALTIISGPDQSRGGQRQALLDQWSEEHPDNQATILEVGGVADAHRSEMVARAQSGRSGVDIYNLDVTWIAEFADAEYLRPLDARSVDEEAFLEQPLATCRYHGELRALPFNTDAGLLYLRADLIPDAPEVPQRLRWHRPGGEATAAPDTIDYWVDRAFDAPDLPPNLAAGYAGQFADYEGLTVNALETIWALGSDEFRDLDWRNPTIDIGQLVEPLRWLADARGPRTGGPPLLIPEAGEYTEADTTEAFRTGKVVFMRNWPVAYRVLQVTGEDQQSVGFDVRALPGPSVPGWAEPRHRPRHPASPCRPTADRVPDRPGPATDPAPRRWAAGHPDRRLPGGGCRGVSAHVGAAGGGRRRPATARDTVLRQLQRGLPGRRPPGDGRRRPAGRLHRAPHRRTSGRTGMRLELWLGKATAEGYPVTARLPDGDEVSGWLRWPTTATDGELDRRLRTIDDSLWLSSARVRWVSSARQAVQGMGGELFEALPDEIQDVLIGSLEEAEHVAGLRLRVLLAVDPPELARLPWEFLYIPERPGAAYQRVFPFLAHHLIRYPPTPPQRPLWTRLPLRILAMVGYASGIDVEEERRRLTEAMRDLEQAGLVELEWIPGHGWRHLSDRLWSGPKPNIVHLVAHGEYDESRGAGVVLLQDDDGQPFRMPPERLTTYLRGRPSIRLVVLNSCGTGRIDKRDPLSSVANALVECGIPAVLGMQFRISDVAAIAFARSFYRALAMRLSVADAVTAARQNIPNELPDSLEWGTPVLYTAEPDVVLFDVSSARLRWEPTQIATVAAPRDVNAVAFSPDSGWLALACDHHRPWQISTDTLAVLDSTPAHPPQPARNSLYGIAFSRDGVWLAAAGLDGTVQVWQRGAGEPRLVIPHPDWVADVAVSPAGRLATACADGVVRLYDISTGEEGWQSHLHRTLDAHDGAVRTVTFDSTGDRLATAADDRTARVWDFSGAPTDTPAAVLRHRRRVFGVAFSPDGQRVATASQDGWVRLWRWSATGPLQSEWRCHRGWALDVAFSPDGHRLATAGRDRTAKVWSLQTLESALTISHRATVRRIAFSPDGRWLATASYDRTCQVWQFDREE